MGATPSAAGRSRHVAHHARRLGLGGWWGQSLINAPWLSRFIAAGAFQFMVAVVRAPFVAAFFAGISKRDKPHLRKRGFAGPFRMAADAAA